MLPPLRREWVMDTSAQKKRFLKKWRKIIRIFMVVLIFTKYNKEIWSENIKYRTRSNGSKMQKMQGCVLKAIGAISNIANTLLDLKTSKNQFVKYIRKVLIAPLIHTCTDTVAILGHFNTPPLNKTEETISLST